MPTTSRVTTMIAGMLASLLVLSLSATPADAMMLPGHGEPSYNESPGCDALAGYRVPYASKTGTLGSSEPIKGPYADGFGRTVGAIGSDLVYWNVPLSSGKRLLVHERALAAFQQVSANIAAAVANGASPSYFIRSGDTYGYTRRTISGSKRISNHTFGTAVDINSATNPYRADDVLVTDMPAWFVEAWTDAGFCWGGHWVDVKDPMHFSWKGPHFTPGYSDWDEVAPVNGKAAFPLYQRLPGEWNMLHQAWFRLFDTNRDGATDSLRVRPWDGGLLIEATMSTEDFAYCAVRRWWSPQASPSQLTFGDRDGDSNVDLWAIDDVGSPVNLTIWTRQSGFEVPEHLVTGASAKAGARYTSADIDRDGRVDLVQVIPGPTTTVEVFSGASGFEDRILSTYAPVNTSVLPWWPTILDRDHDGAADLVIARRSASNLLIAIADGAADFTTLEQSNTLGLPADPIEVQAGELDGDGRADLWALSTDGTLTTWLGGSMGSGSLSQWFRDPAWSCPDDSDLDLIPELNPYLPRYGGANRYDTSALLVSKFVKSATIVYVASGEHFPDALAAGPIAAQDSAPLLLVRQSAIPTAVTAELKRLSPVEIRVVGGPAVVDAADNDRLEKLTGANVVRISGKNRYGTAAELARALGSASKIYVATGESFPDALAAAPVAAGDGAPILLTRQGVLPDETRKAVIDLAPSEIVILGGTAVVSDAVASELANLVPSVTRIAGQSRYGTATKLAQQLGVSDEVFVVSGTTFPDALSVAPIAGMRRSPILLTDPEFLPDPTITGLTSVKPLKIRIAGGKAVVADAVRNAAVNHVWQR